MRAQKTGLSGPAYALAAVGGDGEPVWPPGRQPMVAAAGPSHKGLRRVAGVRHDAVVRRPHVPSVSALVLALAGLGVVLLIVAEFTPLLEVKTLQGNSLPNGVVRTGPHHSWALLPLALLAGVLAYGGARGGSRPALVALGAVGLVVALIAVLGDLPDTSKQDLVGSPA